MADTIKGGAYKSADGTWHDAKGKPLSSNQVQAAQALQRERAAELAKLDQVLAAEAEAVSTETRIAGVEEETTTKRKTRKS